MHREKQIRNEHGDPAPRCSPAVVAPPLDHARHPWPARRAGDRRRLDRAISNPGDGIHDPHRPRWRSNSAENRAIERFAYARAWLARTEDAGDSRRGKARRHPHYGRHVGRPLRRLCCLYESVQAASRAVGRVVCPRKLGEHPSGETRAAVLSRRRREPARQPESRASARHLAHRTRRFLRWPPRFYGGVAGNPRERLQNRHVPRAGVLRPRDGESESLPCRTHARRAGSISLYLSVLAAKWKRPVSGGLVRRRWNADVRQPRHWDVQSSRSLPLPSGNRFCDARALIVPLLLIGVTFTNSFFTLLFHSLPICVEWANFVLGEDK